jgi:integrase
MPRRKRLSDAAIKSLAPSTKPYPDPELPGHYIRVRPTGVKTFVAVARAPSGKQMWHTIGASSLYSINEAREKAREAIKAIKDGKDHSGPQTFEVVADEWFKRHVEGKGLIGSRNFRHFLDRHLIPAWSGRDFTSIRRGDVSKLLDSIQDSSGAVSADFALATIRMVCNWYATRHENYESPIVKGMRRSDPKKHARDRTLNDDEIKEVWRVAEANGTFGAFLRVALLTAQRREKVASMRWSDISENGEWNIPRAEREKGTAGLLALPRAALDIINVQPRLASNEYVFAGIGDSYIKGLTKRKSIFDRKLSGVAPFTIHDLRRTARSLMSRAGVRPDIAERVLGHVQSGVAGVYDRHANREEKAQALKMLAGLVDNILRDDADQKVRRLRG